MVDLSVVVGVLRDGHVLRCALTVAAERTLLVVRFKLPLYFDVSDLLFFADFVEKKMEVVVSTADGRLHLEPLPIFYIARL